MSEKHCINNKNYVYFKENFSAITTNHINKYVVISNCSIIGYFSTIEEAFEYSLKTDIKMGEFLIQKCTETIDTISATYY